MSQEFRAFYRRQRTARRPQPDSYTLLHFNGADRARLGCVFPIDERAFDRTRKRDGDNPNPSVPFLPRVHPARDFYVSRIIHFLFPFPYHADRVSPDRRDDCPR